MGADECGIFIGFVWVMSVNGTFLERVWVNVGEFHFVFGVGERTECGGCTIYSSPKVEPFYQVPYAIYPDFPENLQATSSLYRKGLVLLVFDILPR